MIAIKDFEMPESCYDCPFYGNGTDSDGNYYGDSCVINGANLRIHGEPVSEDSDAQSDDEEAEKRPDNCPLVFVESEGMKL